MAKKVDSRGLPLRTYDSHRRVASTSFAAVLLIIVGVLHLVQGFGALFSDDEFAPPRGTSSVPTARSGGGPTWRSVSPPSPPASRCAAGPTGRGG